MVFTIRFGGELQLQDGLDGRPSGVKVGLQVAVVRFTSE